MRSLMWQVAMTCLVVSLLPVSGAGAAEASAGADEPASSASAASAEAAPDNAVDIVRYSASDLYALSIDVATALVDAGDGSLEWVVLASGESWADAVVAGPLAASLDAAVVLVPPGGLQTPTARPDLVEFLGLAGVRRVVIVGSTEVLPNHEPSVLFGLGMLPRNIERVHGDDPVGNAVAVAERIGAPAQLGELGRTVIIASDQSVADAVAVGPLAAAGPFPLLLTAPDAVDPRITAYLSSQGIDHVVLVGGTAAISPAVHEAIETAGATVTRLAGEDRYHTAVLAMDLLVEVPQCVDDAIDGIGLVIGEESRVALTAGRLLGPQCIPLLFTDAERLAPVTQNYLYLYRHRTGIEPNWHLIGDDVAIDPSAIERPPVRMATVADNPGGDGQHIVVLDENHQARRYLLDERFSWITGVGWSSDYEVIEFWGNRDGTSQDYVLDPRTAALRPRPQRVRVQPWYSSLVRDDWVDVTPSADHKHILYRAPTKQHAGHSIFVYDVEAGSSRMITHNGTDDTHHVLRRRPLDDSRYFYFRQAIDELESGCSGEPSSEVGIFDIAEGSAYELPLEGYVINEELHFSPERTHVALAAYPMYASAPSVDLFNFWYWGCTYYGKGVPSLLVYDISGGQPVRISESPMDGYDAQWSSDNRHLVFRAPSDGYAGHSLFTLDLNTGSVDQVTKNSSDEYHHVLQHWLPDGDRFVYTIQKIDELEGSCHGLVPEQQERHSVPHVAAFVTSLGGRTATRIPFNGFPAYIDTGNMLDFLPGANYIDLRADGDHVIFRTYPEYYLYEGQGSCVYDYFGAQTDLYVYDLSGDAPRPVPIDEVSYVHGRWSPDRRYIAYSIGNWLYGAAQPGFLILDTHTNATWLIDPSDAFGSDARLSWLAWSTNSKQIIFRVTYSEDPNAPETRAVANVEHGTLSALDLTEYADSEIEFRGFSPDGSQVIHQDNGRYIPYRYAPDSGNAPWQNYSPNAGLLYINSIDPSGSLVHTYDLFAASEPAEPVYAIFAEDSGETEQDFSFRVNWTPNGIYAAGYYYLDTHWDF